MNLRNNSKVEVVAVPKDVEAFLKNSGVLTEELQKQMKNKEKVYQELAEYITTKVPLNELSSLINWLGKYRDSFETQIAYHEEFDTFPQDGAVAVYKALTDKFGFVEHKTFWGAAPMMQVQTGPGQTIQVPWGAFALPGYDGLTIHVGTHPTKDGFHFCISGSVKKKDKDVIDDIVVRIRQNLKTNSIYKGKAISLKFSEDFNPMTFEPKDVAPEFLDLTRVDQSELVLSDDIQRMVDDSLFTPVEKTELCKELGIPMRRGVLLAGTYGVGKTLTSQVQALKATRNGWTFIYLKDVKDLAEGLRIARQYAPSVVFAEDIDSVMGGETRDDKMNEILNTIDGIELKGKDVQVVLTTNHVERINRAMIRPGRIDALIEMKPPDAGAAEKLVRVYGKKHIDEKTDLSAVGKLLAGHRPAMIAETVQRAKLSAATRMAVNEDISTFKLLASDLEAAAKSMNHHVALVDGPKEVQISDIEKIGAAQILAHKLASRRAEVSAG